MKDLASELYVEPAFLYTVVELLEEKRQLIFYGPPGTGKTYIARGSRSSCLAVTPTAPRSSSFIPAIRTKTSSRAIARAPGSTAT